VLNAGFQSLRNILQRLGHTPVAAPLQPSLNEKILAYIDRNRHRATPSRETTFQPEILIPCYNHAQYLTHLLEVLQGCGVPMTVVDDHSDKKDRLLIAEMGRRFGVKVIRNDTSLRQPGSLNKAIRMSENNLFIVANADDYLLPGWVPYAIEQFHRHDIYLLGGMHICFFNHFLKSERYLAELLKTSAYAPSSGLRHHGPEDARRFIHDNSIDMTMTGCTFLKSAWDFVGGFYSRADRVSIHDDRDFQMRVCAFFPVAVSDELSALWRSNSSTGMGTT
jgi:glycosyltransferase involved in cell wall biosynthesis